jgi:hypothetical protein
MTLECMCSLSGRERFRLRELRRRLHRAPTATIRWHTFGLSEALNSYLPYHVRKPIGHLERVSRRAGFLCSHSATGDLALHRRVHPPEAGDLRNLDVAGRTSE